MTGTTKGGTLPPPRLFLAAYALPRQFLHSSNVESRSGRSDTSSDLPPSITLALHHV